MEISKAAGRIGVIRRKTVGNRESYHKTKEGNSFKTGRRCSYNAD